MSLHEFTKQEKNAVSESIIISLLTSLITFGIWYYVQLHSIENFIADYGFFIFFAILSYVLILPSEKTVRAYKEFPCMSGMMIGMTVGMISGFLSGFFVGATNGIFWGSVFGMAVGMIFGARSGKCCGIMGVMEGMMAGFMGGLMGAMTSLMMYNDHLRAAGVIVFIISAVIMTGLQYMIYKESKILEKNKSVSNLITIALSFILTLLTIWFMVYGPRGGLFQ